MPEWIIWFGFGVSITIHIALIWALVVVTADRDKWFNVGKEMAKQYSRYWYAYNHRMDPNDVDPGEALMVAAEDAKALIAAIDLLDELGIKRGGPDAR